MAFHSKPSIIICFFFCILASDAHLYGLSFLFIYPHMWSFHSETLIIISYNVLKSMFKFNPNIFYNICQWKIRILLLLNVKFGKAALETLQNYCNSQFTHCRIIFHPSKSLTLFLNQFNFWLTSGPKST